MKNRFKLIVTATIFACLIDLMNEHQEINNISLVSKFYGWSKEKSRFTESRILTTWKWMVEKNIIPSY